MIFMKVILKPMGLAILGVAMTALVVLAMRAEQQRHHSLATPVEKTEVVTSSVPEMTIYDNALKNGWTNFSWGKNNFADNKSFGGNVCIRAEPGPFEATYFHHEPMSVAGYDRITFRLNGGAQGGQQLKLAVQLDNNGKNEAAGELELPPLPAKTWKTCTVTFRRLGVADKPNVVGFWLQEAHGKKKSPAYYVDDVRLLRPSDLSD